MKTFDPKEGERLMKISFLVTYYQQAKLVSESMDSILALEKPDEWEILIGDDGSSDGTVNVAQSYVDRDPKHVRLFVMDRDPKKTYNAVERASLNRLNLVRHASGDCYCLMDGDDFYSETDFIPQAIMLLETHPEVSVVAFDTWMYREGQSRKAGKPGSTEPVFESRKRYLRWQYTHAGACVFRNSHTEANLRMLENLSFFDDNDITLNALNAGKLIRIHRPVYAYRQAENSVYTTMCAAERAALNLAGLGACLRIMDPIWEKDVVARFATAVWMAWFLRKDLENSRRSSRFRGYQEACHRIGFRQGELLLRYAELERREQKEVRKWVRYAGRESPLRVAFAWTQVRGWRRKA